MLTIYGIPNCDTVKKARAWLDKQGLSYVFHDYKKLGIDAATLKRWSDAMGWNVLFNRASITFRALPDADKADIDREKAIALMIASPSLIKRPVVEGRGVILVGFKPEVWAGAFESLP